MSLFRSVVHQASYRGQINPGAFFTNNGALHHSLMSRHTALNSSVFDERMIRANVSPTAHTRKARQDAPGTQNRFCIRRSSDGTVAKVGNAMALSTKFRNSVREPVSRRKRE
jgi:hypothetical protein